MKVTGWTYWGDSNYIDIYYKAMEMRGEAMNKAPKFPTREEYINMSKEEKDKFFEMREKLINELLDTPEIYEINKLIDECYKTVLECVKNNKYHFTGDDHQNADWGVPVLDNKYKLCIGQRSWGELIACAFPDEIDNSEGCGYTKWAWSTPEGEEDKVKIPINN